jgi:hypothetical protein
MIGYNGKFTKNQYKEKIKTMSFNELIDEQTKIKRVLMIARMEMSRDQNPMDKKTGMDKKAEQVGLDKFGSMKLIKWKHAYVSQKLHDAVVKK